VLGARLRIPADTIDVKTITHDYTSVAVLALGRKQTSVSAAAMSDADPDPSAECDCIICYDGARFTDKPTAPSPYLPTN
jgi:hypothetical protein